MKANPDHLNKAVVITARVHPGESISSWMMKGVIDFLIGDSIEAQALRKLFVFKIIPMLNPDGVINGNYRCSLSGCDLNRRWKSPSKVVHPTVFYTKKLCRQIQKERELVLFCDLHGHSRQKNIFMYGNNIPEDPQATRMFPYVMSKLFDFFSFKHSKFSMAKSKETTARIALFKELKIP
jgi:cytosolic carboxypeptidase protein 2/3